MEKLFTSAISLLWLCSVTVGAHAQTCSEGGLSSFVTARFSQSEVVFPKGTILVVHDSFMGRSLWLGSQYNPDKSVKALGKLQESYYRKLLAMAHLGAITVTPVPHEARYGWNEINAIGQGIFEIVDIQPGTLRSDQTFSENFASFKAIAGKFGNVRFASTQSLHSAADEYCLASYTYSREIKPNFVPIIGPSGDRKVRQLLKLDVFKKSWAAVAADVADVHEPFSTRDVDNQISALSLSR